MNTAEDSGLTPDAKENEVSPSVTWWEYFNRVIGDTEVLSHVADRLELNRASITKWRYRRPDVKTVRQFALLYHRPVTESLIAAGYMTPDDLGIDWKLVGYSFLLIVELKNSAEGGEDE